MKLNLTAKFTLIASTVLVSGMVLFAYFSANSLEKILLNEAIKDLDSFSETILSTTYHQMLLDDRGRVYQAIAEVGSQEGVKRIRLINKDGEIRFSTQENEIGTAIDKSGPSCNMCHSANSRVPLVSASSMSRSRRYSERSGEEVLGMTRGIYNQATCSTADCHFHEAETKLLGVLDMTVSLSEMRELIRNFKVQILFSTFGLIFTMAISLALVTGRFVHRPVRDLLEHTRRLSRGDLRGRIESHAKDEIGELEQAFNEMTASVQVAQEDLRDLASSLETKVEQRTKQIQEMQSHLVRSEKLASLGELVAGIAHEINNPLSGILMFSSLAANAPEVPTQIKENLEVVVSEAKRCAKIIHGLLEFSRESIPEKRLESINRTITKTLKLVTHQPLYQDIDVRCQLSDDIPDILFDTDQLQQVFFNLFVNAGQAMENGGTLRLSSELYEANQSVIIKVIDTGNGISEENLGRIFDPFFSTKDEKGFGLGLSVSYGIIENHGGQIIAQSQLGEGTQFTIYLPISKEAPRLAIDD